jgi:glycosyltransferase involved in cell wall biosynthesis
VPALLTAADLFVSASRHEPLGNVVIEAWAQGRPVIATDAAGPATLIEHMESGVLVPVDDATTLGQAIRYVLSDEGVSDRLARGGHAAYQAHFTEALVVRQYMDFFQKIVT